MATGALLDDLLNIEVDVIVGDLTSGAMPTVDGTDLAPAMRDVHRTYVEWLDDHFPVGGDDTGGRERGEFERGESGRDDWERLEARADAAARQLADAIDAGRPLDPSAPSMLRRIGGNAAQLKAVANGDVSDPVDRVRIVRKAWEVGTRTIVAQTVVQLDGDAVTRVDEDRFLSDRHAELRALHHDAVQEALGHWRVLVDLVIGLVTSVGQIVLAFVRHPGQGLADAKRWWNDRRHRDTGQELSARDLLRKRTWARIRADWQHFRDSVLPLFAEGGATIESPSGRAPGDDPSARTVIQPDGDALWFVSADAADDAAALREHSALVTSWYGGSAAAVDAVRQIVTAFQRVVTGVVAVVGVALTVASGVAWGWWALAFAIGIALLAVLLLLGLRAGIGHFLRKKVGLAGG